MQPSFFDQGEVSCRARVPFPLAPRLTFADGTGLFLKAISTDHVLYTRYLEEAAINQALPDTVPVPRLLRSWETGGWLLMAFQDIDGRHPQLTPTGPDTDRALALPNTLPGTVTPTPITDAPDFVDAVGEEIHGWQTLADTGADLDPWSTRNLAALAAAERSWYTAAQGNTTLHADLCPDNMLLTGTGAYVIDWAYLHQGAAWVDPVGLTPHLIRAGHTPAEAEALMATVTSWSHAPVDAVTGFATAMTGYWERSSRRPGPPGVPTCVPIRRRWPPSDGSGSGTALAGPLT